MVCLWPPPLLQGWGRHLWDSFKCGTGLSVRQCHTFPYNKLYVPSRTNGGQRTTCRCISEWTQWYVGYIKAIKETIKSKHLVIWLLKYLQRLPFRSDLASLHFKHELRKLTYRTPLMETLNQPNVTNDSKMWRKGEKNNGGGGFSLFLIKRLRSHNCTLITSCQC